MTELTAERLRELLDYDTETGVFKWINPPRQKRHFIGRVPGNIGADGYKRMVIDQKRYLIHRLVWLYVHGRWPIDQIDHIDRDRQNNKIMNLREATPSQNSTNGPRRSTNRSGLKGAGFHRPSGKYIAHIKKEGRRFYLGFFETAEDAHAAYCIAARDLHGDFARMA